MEWFKRAAIQNDADAQNALGLCYQEGHGVQQDRARAFYFLMEAAKQSHPAGEYNVGVALLNGDGVNRDPCLAALWLKRAANKNVAMPIIGLGEWYMNRDRGPTC